jgi:manganese/zinc/iron transport system substrate-binding protein
LGVQFNWTPIFMRPFFVLILVFILALGCSAPENADDPRLSVVTTTSMIADLVREIGGEHVRVEGLMGPGVDPHLYKASEGDVSRMTNADVVFFNGLHLEGKMVDIFEQMGSRGMSVVGVTEFIPVDRLLESELFVGNYDPHVWFDVRLWKDVARTVTEELKRQRPEVESYFSSNADRYMAELDSLDAWARTELARIPRAYAALVTSHDAFGYFGRAYDLDVRGLQGISTATEAGTSDVQELAAFVSERQIPAMFLESSISPRGIEAVLAAVRSRGFEVRIGGTLFGDALGSPDSDAGTYVGMVRSNVRTIVQGLTQVN